MRHRRFLLFAALLLLLGSGGFLIGRRGYLGAKGMLAERLIDRALKAHLTDGRPHRPWSWADMHPIASLEVERLDVRRNVLRGASGESLAFGVGHVDGTALPNAPGHCVLAGHRDKGFAFLEDLRPGDSMIVRTFGRVREYVVDGIRIVPRTATGILDPTPEDRLTLVTCYPFGGLLRSPWRYIVTAGAAGPPPRSRTTVL